MRFNSLTLMNVTLVITASVSFQTAFAQATAPQAAQQSATPQAAAPQVSAPQISSGQVVMTGAAANSAGAAGAPGTPPKSTPKPPDKVDKALRARAQQFVQDELEGSFRKSFELVAPDSQDFYFSIPKEKPGKFQIGDIEYSDKFTKAVVHVPYTRKMTLPNVGQLDVPSMRADTWKLEKGKWVWYHDTSQIMTMFGPMAAPKSTPAAATQAKLPPGMPTDTSPEAVAAAAAKIAKGTSVDKQKLEFAEGKADTQEIVFHNGYPGNVKVLVDIPRDYQGFTVDNSAASADNLLGPQKDLPVKITYQPGPDTPKVTTLRFSVEPFGTVIRVPISVSKAPASPTAAATPAVQ